MASTMFSYQKLSKNQTELEEKEEKVYASRSRGWLKPSRSHSYRRRRWWRRRPRVRIPRLRRLVGRKARVVRAAVRKVVKRLKEGRAHIGDLFAGNYMFMQVNPAPPMGYLEKPFMAGQGGHALPAPSSRYYLPWVA